MRRALAMAAIGLVLLFAGAAAAGGPSDSNAPIDRVIVGVLDTTTMVWTSVRALPGGALQYDYLGPQDLPVDTSMGEVAGQGTPCALILRTNQTWRIECTDGRGTDWRSRKELAAMTVM